VRGACFNARMGQRSVHKRALQSLPRCMGRTERRLEPRTMSAPLWMSCSGHAADLQVALTLLHMLFGGWASNSTSWSVNVLSVQARRTSSLSG